MDDSLNAKRLAILQDLINEVKPSMLSMAKAVANLTDEEFRKLLEIGHKHICRSDEETRLRNALIRLAAFDDSDASGHLAETGSYAGFYQPDAVRVARETLKAVGYVHES